MTGPHNDYFCVILAGGKGRRLWPCSRENQPKQFVDFFGSGRTQLQQTFDRFAAIVPPENIFVSTNRQYAHYVYEQLPELPHENVLSEPIHRNTAPSVAWAAYRISHINPEAKVIVSPSDQAVFKEEAFRNNVEECFETVESKNWIIALGVKPTRPEPGYGYIQLGMQHACQIRTGMRQGSPRGDGQEFCTRRAKYTARIRRRIGKEERRI
jgi:mannose-1-phosphate guanylyltransferase